MKKIWRISSIIVALAAGLFLYDGGKLLFVYQDVRLGGFVLAAGCMEVLGFVWCTYKCCRKGKSKRGRKIEAAVTWTVCGIVASGVEMYRLKLENVGSIVIIVSVTMIIMAGIGNLVLAAEEQFPIVEREFCERILQKKEIWKGQELYVEDEISSGIYSDTLEGRFGIIELTGIVLTVFWVYLLGDKRTWLTILLIGTGIIIAILVIRDAGGIRRHNRMVRLLEGDNSRSILGFFVTYYESAKCRNESQMCLTQLNAVIALYDRGAYEDALELLRTIKRSARLEIYFLPHEWLVREALGDMDGCAEIIRKMEDGIKSVKGKNKESLEERLQLYRDFTEGRYDAVIERIETAPGACSRVRRANRKLAEDAKRARGDL